jgi:DNA repair protein RadC
MLVLETRTFEVKSITNPAHAAKLIREFIGDAQQEHFMALTLDAKSQPIRLRVVHIGTVNATIVDARDIFRNAILDHAVSVIVAHNHPSGDPEPSNEDIEVTAKLKECAKLLGFDLLDHVIVGTKGKMRYASLERMKLM